MGGIPELQIRRVWRPLNREGIKCHMTCGAPDERHGSKSVILVEVKDTIADDTLPTADF